MKYIILLILLIGGCATTVSRDLGTVVQISKCNKPYAMMINLEDEFYSRYVWNIESDPLLFDKMRDLEIKIHKNVGTILTIDLDEMLKMDLCDV